MVAPLPMHVLKLCMEGTQLLSISEWPMPREDIGDKFRWDADDGNFFGQDHFEYLAGSTFWALGG